MSKDEEFKAPAWIEQGEEGPRDVTKKEKMWLNVFLFVFIPFCLWAGWFEFGRAQEGNWRAWVYTFEWPFFAIVAFILWRKFMRGSKLKIPRPDVEKLNRLADEDEKN